MSDSGAAIRQPSETTRWRLWQARGVAADRRRTVASGWVFSVIVIVLAIWLAIQLV
jgi:hypothetical protein